MKFLPAFLLLSSSILSGAGCASAVGSSPEVGVAEASVVGGWQGRDQELYSTVEVRSRQPSYGFCTGTLIARRLVLTAGHCVSDMDDEGELELTPPSQIQVGAGYLRSNLHQEGQVVSVERIILHDAFDGEFLHSQRGGDASGMGHPNDLALLVLSQPITVIEPASVLDHDLMQQILSPGTIGLVSGYGVFDFDAQRAGTLYLAEASIDRVAPTEILTDGDFGDTCFGDSGGPLYLPHEGRLYVAGVVSRGRADVNVDCGAGGIYTLTSAYGSWIRKHAERELEQSELEDTGTDWERLGSADGNLDAYINSVTGNPPGCSASPVRTDSAGFGWFAFAALGLLVHRHRRR